MDHYLSDLDKGRRTKGKTFNKLARETRVLAASTGKLPHEILLDIARGRPIAIPRISPVNGEIIWQREGVPMYDYVVPDLGTIVDAAKAAAPYFAPKISTVEVIQGVSDNELDRIIALAAAEAGISVSLGGEGEEDEEEGDAAESASPRVRLKLDE